MEKIECNACEGTGKSLYFLHNYMVKKLTEEENIKLLASKNQIALCPVCNGLGKKSNLFQDS